jgi:hypothetical protein
VKSQTGCASGFKRLPQAGGAPPPWNFLAFELFFIESGPYSRTGREMK